MDSTIKSQIHFIGLGGGGLNALKLIFDQEIEGKYSYIDKEERKDIPKEIEFVQFTVPENQLDISNLGPIGRNLPMRITDIFIKDFKYILLSGLGGETGTFLMQELANWLKINKNRFLVIMSLPFSFEGMKRNNVAKNAVLTLKSVPNIRYISMESIREKYGNLLLSQAFFNADLEFLLEVAKSTDINCNKLFELDFFKADKNSSLEALERIRKLRKLSGQSDDE